MRCFQSRVRDAQQISRGKLDRLPRATARFTTSALDGYGLCGHRPARPAPYASDLVLVHRLARLLRASFRPSVAGAPLRFAMTSPPSGCQRDFHPQTVEHARHTQNGPVARRDRAGDRNYEFKNSDAYKTKRPDSRPAFKCHWRRIQNVGFKFSDTRESGQKSNRGARDVRP